MNSPIIELDHISKFFQVKKQAAGFGASLQSLLRPTYKEIRAVDDLCLRVQPSEFLALIGPNGAGKSTTIKMLTGILTPTAGTIKVNGLIPFKQRQQLAYTIGAVYGARSQLWYHLPAQDTYDLFARLYELDDKVYKERLDFLVTTFDIGSLIDFPVRKLSLGQRMRCELVASLLHKPGILLLDEPTIGLDVIAKQQVRKVLKQLNEQEGTTIVLTSHDAGDIEMLAHRTVIINYGTVVFDDSTENLKKRFITTKIVEFVLDEPFNVSWPYGTVIEKTPISIKVAVDVQNNAIADVMSFAMQHGKISDINIYDQPLEEIIAAIYRMSKEATL
jgi:ABC-2 type transport system ATP-binding protein